MRHILSLLFVISTFSLSAQTIKVEGNIDADSSETIFGQFIIYSQADSSLIKGSYLDSTYFSAQFDSKGIENFYIKLSVTGYSDTIISFSKSNQTISLGTIKMTNNRTLGAVDVVFIKPEFERTMDGIKINVQGTSLQTLNTLYDILIASPKLASPDGERIEIIGKGSPLILIDRQAIISNDELKAIPANMVESIEIITNPSAKYKAQGSGNGVIEVFTKNFTLEGYNMNVSSNFGMNTQTKPTGGLNMGINLKRKKFSLNGYLGGNYNTSNGFGNSIGFTTDDSNRSRESVYTNDNWNSWQYYQVKAAYQLNQKHKITTGVRGHGSLGGNELISTTDYYYGNEYQTTESNFYDPSYSWLNNSAFVNYVWETDTNRSAFEVNLNLIQKSSNSKSTSLSTYQHITSGIYSEYNVQIESYDRPWIGELRVNYDHVFDTSGWKLNFGGSYSELLNGKIYNQYYLQNNEWIIDPVYSNSYDYREKIGAIFTEVSKNWDKLGFRLGVRGEYTGLYGYSNSLEKEFIDSSYLLLFPSASILIEPSKNVGLTFSYNSGIERPQFSNYDPFVRIQDSLQINYGNPYLRPSVSHTFGIDIDLFYAYNLSLSYTHTNDPESQLSFINDSTFLINTTPWNAKMDQSFSASLNLPLQFKWLQGWNSMWVNYGKYTFTEDFGRTPFFNLTYGVYSYLTFLLPKDFTIMNQLHVMKWGNAEFSTNTRFSWGLRFTKKFMENNFQVYLEVSNIIPPKSNYQQFNGNYQHNNFGQDEFTSFKVGLFYKFGRLKQADQIKESNSGQSDRL